MPILTFRSVIIEASEIGIAHSGDTMNTRHGGLDNLGNGSVGKQGSAAEDL
jgi:hypothetical protein